jgi:hypothetical protein
MSRRSSFTLSQPMSFLCRLLYLPGQDICLKLYACPGSCSWKDQIIGVQRIFRVGIQTAVSHGPRGVDYKSGRGLTQSNAMATLDVSCLVCLGSRPTCPFSSHAPWVVLSPPRLVDERIFCPGRPCVVVTNRLSRPMNSLWLVLPIKGD